MELCGLNWSEIYDLNDTTLIAASITEKICTPLKRMAPIKLRNIKTNKKKGWNLSSEVRLLMKERDELKIRAKITNNTEDWDVWKRVKNRVNRIVRKEKGNMKENEIKEISNDSTAKSLWNYIKRKACWSSSLAPTILRVGETEYTSSPVKMYQTQSQKS